MKENNEKKIPDLMVFVERGCFEMGDTFGDGGSDEKPAHEVCVDEFYISKYLVTQKFWKKVMGANPSSFYGCDDCPVESVGWADVHDFLRKLNEKTGMEYRLPTEAEWEFAARSGGKQERWAGTNEISELGDYAWYSDNSDGKTHPVGQKKPNGFGLYDMTGNVMEWVQDWYRKDYYQRSPKENPSGPESGVKGWIYGAQRVLRGGSWVNGPELVRVADRYKVEPADWNDDCGFRLAISVKK